LVRSERIADEGLDLRTMADGQRMPFATAQFFQPTLRPTLTLIES
jgi:hypothetical protein